MYHEQTNNIGTWRRNSNSLLIELRNDLAIHHEWLGSSWLSGLAVARLEGILLGRLVAKGMTCAPMPTTRPAASDTSTSTSTAIVQPPFASRLLALVRSLGLMMMAGGSRVRLVAAAALAGFGHAFVRLYGAVARPS